MELAFDEGHVPETGDEDGDLKAIGSNQEVESNGGPGVSLEEDHQESETHEDHNMDILEEGVVNLHVVSLVEDLS